MPRVDVCIGAVDPTAENGLGQIALFGDLRERAISYAAETEGVALEFRRNALRRRFLLT